MKHSTKTALIAGGSIVGAAGVGGLAWWLTRPKATPPTQTPSPPTPLSPVWTLATTQILATPAQYQGQIVQDVFPASLVAIPDKVQALSFWLYLTNISTQNQRVLFGGQIVQHGSGQVIFTLQQAGAPKTLLPNITGSVQLVTPYSGVALASMNLPDGVADLVFNALSADGSITQTFSITNAVQVVHANAGSVQAGGCPNKVVAGPFWPAYGGAMSVFGPSPQQMALRDAQAAMASLQRQYPSCSLQVLTVRATNTGTSGYVVAAGNPPASALRFTHSPPRVSPV